MICRRISRCCDVSSGFIVNGYSQVCREVIREGNFAGVVIVGLIFRSQRKIDGFPVLKYSVRHITGLFRRDTPCMQLAGNIITQAPVGCSVGDCGFIGIALVFQCFAVCDCGMDNQFTRTAGCQFACPEGDVIAVDGDFVAIHFLQP